MEYIPTKTIISSYKENPHWFGINYNMNIYKGCCHGCIYCDSRSSCYQIIDRYNLLYRMEDIINGYKSKYEKTQISWF